MSSIRRWTSSCALLAVGCLLAATLSARSSEPGVARPSLTAARDRNPFDASSLEPAPPVQQPEQIEKSQLPVTLLGTFAADDASLSRATLLDRESQETLVVGIGDEVEGQALVVQIDRERVVLRENGATRELTLGEAGHGVPPSTGPSPSAPSTRAPENEQALPTHLLSQARVLPKFEDGGQMVGLEIGAIQAGSLFEEIGLEDGDVITEFNGDPIDSQAKAWKVLREMSEQSAYRVAGLRGDGSEQVWDFARSD